MLLVVGTGLVEDSQEQADYLVVGTGLVEDSRDQADYNASSGRYWTSGR